LNVLENENGYQPFLCRDSLATLTNEPSKLTRLAEVALRRARDPKEDATDRVIWFGLASEAYRVLGNLPSAAAAAREGMPLIAPALSRFDKKKLDTYAERRAAVALTISPALDPVIALYRAGARDEAIQSGFLSGYERFRNATIAGEVPDARWIVEDRTDTMIESTLNDLMRTPNPEVSLQLHDALQCFGPSGYVRAKLYEYETDLATLAALAGNVDAMRTHLARAAKVIDVNYRNDGNGLKGHAALELAASWRRALVIAARVTSRAAARGPCGAPN
jgi:hypothetical protein